MGEKIDKLKKFLKLNWSSGKIVDGLAIIGQLHKYNVDCSAIAQLSLQVQNSK